MLYTFVHDLASFRSQGKSGNSLVISDRDAYFKIPDRIQHLQRLRHLHKLARVVQIHECSSKLSSLQILMSFDAAQLEKVRHPPSTTSSAR